MGGKRAEGAGAGSRAGSQTVGPHGRFQKICISVVHLHLRSLPCLCPFPCLSCSFGSMAKWGEGDPRWIVEERPDSTNVNNWHWYAAQHRIHGFERAGEQAGPTAAAERCPAHGALARGTLLAYGPHVRPSPAVLACPTRPRSSRAPALADPRSRVLVRAPRTPGRRRTASRGRTSTCGPRSPTSAPKATADSP